MILAKVEKKVVSTAKLKNLPHVTYYTCTPLSGFAKSDESILALDSVSAREGDTVLILGEGTGTREVFNQNSVSVPAQMTIVGIVDEIEWWNEKS
tara:strand:- start:6614 stop:6898 length:285 start_codon:yes stop_codon:yes gene_type:complete